MPGTPLARTQPPALRRPLTTRPKGPTAHLFLFITCLFIPAKQKNSCVHSAAAGKPLQVNSRAGPGPVSQRQSKRDNWEQPLLPISLPSPSWGTFTPGSMGWSAGWWWDSWLLSPHLSAATGTARWLVLGFLAPGYGTVRVKPREEKQVHIWDSGDTFSGACAPCAMGEPAAPACLGGGSPSLGGMSPPLGGESAPLGGGSPPLEGGSPSLGAGSPSLGGVSPSLQDPPGLQTLSRQGSRRGRKGHPHLLETELTRTVRDTPRQGVTERVAVSSESWLSVL